MAGGPTPALPPCALHTDRSALAAAAASAAAVAPPPHPSDAFRTLFHAMAKPPPPPLPAERNLDLARQSSSPRKSSDSSSPEFEFWRVRNACGAPEPDLVSADELFADGVLLPLHRLRETQQLRGEGAKLEETVSADGREEETQPAAPATAPVSASAEPVASTSRRWKDIFKIGEKIRSEGGVTGTAGAEEERDGGEKTEKTEKARKQQQQQQKKKKERKSSAAAASSVAGVHGGLGGGAADLNINIWPFARSRSAGTTGSRPKSAAGPPRKASSAPCSRSNSGGESKSKKWPASPGRTPLSGGVHLGRSSPVWQVRRGSGAKTAAFESASRTWRRTSDGGGSSSGKGRVLNLNVPLCIGYRHNLSCRSDSDGAGDGNGNGNGGNGSLFNFRNLFSKKVY
ncbi:hypothetical protein H6P81_020025 [Aristolochia fimbriata]|uniref:Uncharacterized protein n=1 Tax=Aristolochia fimbriata TaxID=158543 RepID=A0AAV7DTD5_ARIFI|nr:hypothetical protein H6P81_020025 [Aristolochia fimbriata]